jgi:predicted nucleotidyltransferase/DNA-binding HxlR family transcriptional regulator
MIDEYSYKVLLALKALGRGRFKDLQLSVTNPRTLSLKLKALNERGLVVAEDGLYKLTELGRSATDLLSSLYQLLAGRDFQLCNLDRIPHRVYAPVIERYCKILYLELGNRLLGIMLFGSIARGDWNRDSDIDLLLVAKGWEGLKVWERLRQLMKARELLRETPEYDAAVRAGYWPVFQHYLLAEREVDDFHRIYLDATIDGNILYDPERILTRALEKTAQNLTKLGAKRIQTADKKRYWILHESIAGEVFTL